MTSPAALNGSGQIGIPAPSRPKTAAAYNKPQRPLAISLFLQFPIMLRIT
jgi:hypothetical protein